MKHKWTIVISIIIFATIVFVFGFNKKDNDAEVAENNLFSFDFGGQLALTEDSQLNAVAESGKAPENAKDFETLPPQNLSRYTDKKYNFSFDYPAFVTVGSFKEGVGDMILIQTKDNKASAQIFIIPFDEPVAISKERILKDLPNMVIKDERNGAVGGHPAIAFLGKHETLGDTYEIWFTRDGNLYQIITKVSTFQFLINIIKTWTTQD